MQVSNDGFEDGSSQADPRHAHDRPMTSLKGPIMHLPCLHSFFKPDSPCLHVFVVGHDFIVGHTFVVGHLHTYVCMAASKNSRAQGWTAKASKRLYKSLVKVLSKLF